ncbi:MAG: glycosyltransferase [Pseudomonadota bacterium]
MIFLTVGTQLPFLRLVEAVEGWAGQHPDQQVIAQLGDGGKSPHMTCHRVLDPSDFRDLCVKADLIVSHAGTGSFLMAHQVDTPLLVMPRRADLGEHRNDHQMATAAHFEGRPGVHVVYEAGDVAPSIDRLIAGDGRGPRFADHADDSLITAIRDVVFAHGAP